MAVLRAWPVLKNLASSVIFTLAFTVTNSHASCGLIAVRLFCFVIIVVISIIIPVLAVQILISYSVILLSIRQITML